MSAWMQGISLTEINFQTDYHHALKNINVNSEEILKKLWDAMEVLQDGDPSNDELPAVIKMQKKKKI